MTWRSLRWPRRFEAPEVTMTDLSRCWIAKKVSKVLVVIKMDLGRFRTATEALEVIRMAMIWSGTVKQVSGAQEEIRMDLRSRTAKKASQAPMYLERAWMPLWPSRTSSKLS